MPPNIGRALPRREDRRLITGRGAYAGDLVPDRLLHLAVHRSVQAHGRIVSIETETAAAMPGVVAVWTAADLPESASHMKDRISSRVAPKPRPVLGRGEVRYVGEPVAIVLAEGPYLALDAAEAILAEIEPLPAVAGVDSAVAAGAPPVHGDLEGGNLTGHATHGFGDVDAAFGPGAIVARVRLQAARVAGAAMEPRAVTAAAGADGEVTVWTSTQSVFYVRRQLAAILGVAEDKVRVILPDVGGGFGGKAPVYQEEALAALAARALGRPVRWVASRSEETSSAVHAHGSVFALELAASPDGRLRGLRGRILHDIGAYVAVGTAQPYNYATHMLSAYVLPAMAVASDLVFTNAAPTGYIRGGGRPLGNFAIERLMDRLAVELAMDPAELRRRNLVQRDQMPYDTGYPIGRAGNIVYDGGDYPRMLRMALEGIGYDEIRARPPAQDGRLIGVGIACCVESSGWGGDEPARVRIDKDGTARLWIGSSPGGQGHLTVAAQVLADRLGWPLDRIQVVAGDTGRLPPAENTAGSRTAVQVGNAAAQAGAAARRRLLTLAAEVMEAGPEDLVLEDGRISVKGAPSRSIPATDAVPGDGLDILEKFNPALPNAYSSGCHAALVAVDAETGAVEVLRYVIVHDTGRAINPLLVEGQIQGGFAHGIGYALFEEAVYQPDGAFTSASFLDYSIPGAPEIDVEPHIEHFETPTDANPEGFKGAGESGTIPVPAAIAGAIEDAIRRARPDAVVERLPITPMRVFRLLHPE
ncbi:MAG: xanthine dehydrogenase family protein molybdopterin-binding subunit [Candidatus Dormibacteraceae bacterium]